MSSTVGWHINGVHAEGLHIELMCTHTEYSEVKWVFPEGDDVESVYAEDPHANGVHVEVHFQGA